jgi:hypothetical protein
MNPIVGQLVTPHFPNLKNAPWKKISWTFVHVSRFIYEPATAFLSTAIYWIPRRPILLANIMYTYRKDTHFSWLLLLHEKKEKNIWNILLLAILIFLYHHHHNTYIKDSVSILCAFLLAIKVQVNFPFRTRLCGNNIILDNFFSLRSIQSIFFWWNLAIGETKCSPWVHSFNTKISITSHTISHYPSSAST